MLNIILAGIIGTAMGAEPSGSTDQAAAQPETAPQTETADAGLGGFGDDEQAPPETAQREPEPQVPTGKYTTATEVRPILSMTKTNWVNVRLFNDQDLVYFTHLMAWRCGLWEIRYGINGAPATEVLEMEPCNEEYAQPNAMIDVENYLPYITLPPGSVESIMVEITYDDGTTDFARANRGDVLIP